MANKKEFVSEATPVQPEAAFRPPSNNAELESMAGQSMMADPRAQLQGAILDAIASRYVSQRACAVANLNNYLTNSVGVGEHADIVGECQRLVESINEAEGMLETIRNITS